MTDIGCECVYNISHRRRTHNIIRNYCYELSTMIFPPFLATSRNTRENGSRHTSQTDIRDPQTCPVLGPVSENRIARTSQTSRTFLTYTSRVHTDKQTEMVRQREGQTERKKEREREREKKR